MTGRSTLDHFAQCCAGATDGIAVSNCGLAFYESFGIDMVSYHGDSAGSPAVQFCLTAQGDERRWRSDFLDIDLLRDSPIEALARRRGQAFWWSEVPEFTRLGAAEKAYLESLRESCPHDGLSMHVYGPQGSSAVVGLGFSQKQPDLSVREIFLLHSAAQIAHLRYCALVLNQTPPDVGLSPREIEVLEWIAAGKSNGVIAEILGISPHTVDTIVRRIFAKLEVNDRTTAAIRGLGAGLLRKLGDDGA